MMLLRALSLAVCLISNVAACGEKHDNPVIEYTKYSVVVYGEGDKDVVENWQKEVIESADDAEVPAATIGLWESFQSNGGVKILSELCAEYKQNLAIFTLIYSDSGQFSHARVVFPQKDEGYDKNVPKEFFNELFSSLKGMKVDSFAGTSPYLKVFVPIKDYKTGGNIAVGLKCFYSVYMRNFLNGRDNSNLCRTHMSDDLIGQLNRIGRATGSDAVVKAQDMNEDAIKTLKVESVSDGWYLVTYCWNRNKPESVTSIRVKAKWDEIGICKILDIESSVKLEYEYSDFTVVSDKEGVLILANSEFSSMDDYEKLVTSTTCNDKDKETIDKILYYSRLSAETVSFAINSKGKIEAVQLQFDKDNTKVFSKDDAIILFDELYGALSFATWDGKPDCKFVSLNLAK